MDHHNFAEKKQIYIHSKYNEDYYKDFMELYIFT